MKPIWIGCSILLTAAFLPSASYAQKADGKTQYLNHCASCHGTEGKGDGPVAKSLSPAPADLTRLSAANNGVFPSDRLYEVIDGRRALGAHGTREMPVWGLATRVSPAKTRASIRAVVDYLATLQGK